MMITVDVSPQIQRQLEHSWGAEMAQRIRKAIAAEGYRQRVLSRKDVGEMLGLDLWQTEAFLKEYGLPMHYDLSDLDADLLTNQEIVRK